MTTITDMLNKVRTVDLEKRVPEIIQETSGTLISLNQKQLFNEGVNTDGEVIGVYAPLTEILSKGRKKAGTHYTLFDTGAYYRGMFITVDKEKITFDSRDSKAKMLGQRLGENILGLTQKSLETYISSPGLVVDKIRDYIRKQTGLL